MFLYNVIFYQILVIHVLGNFLRSPLINWGAVYTRRDFPLRRDVLHRRAIKFVVFTSGRIGILL